MPGKSSVRSRNRPTATSSAAMRAALARGPAAPASRAIRSAGKRDSSGAWKSSVASWSSPSRGAGDAYRSGNVSAYWMGMRMSGCPSWALTDPSTNSTAEWMTLWGWITTEIRSRPTSYSRSASMTSRPLFIMVAELIVILAPMRHVGCASAISGVTSASAARGVERNGPPEAVSQMRAIEA